MDWIVFLYLDIEITVTSYKLHGVWNRLIVLHIAKTKSEENINIPESSKGQGGFGAISMGSSST